MGIHKAYYARDWKALASYAKPFCEDTARLKETHVLVRELEAGSLDEVFRIQQGEVWSPNGEQRDLIYKLGLMHTSMSVGDVVEDPEGVFWECRPVGWNNLGRMKVTADESPEQPTLQKEGA